MEIVHWIVDGIFAIAAVWVAFKLQTTRSDREETAMKLAALDAKLNDHALKDLETFTSKVEHLHDITRIENAIVRGFSEVKLDLGKLSDKIDQKANRGED